ncbi:RBBP9/YdeN family alpha/beta hydrolase [Hymenobacter sp. B81]|uniref:RBBP9/YdeN family alpha/beta hydrolase n=1 Tax=Hymenobacter sp. B81 TaxID=3344878 RepID=UPI0037DD19FD
MLPDSTFTFNIPGLRNSGPDHWQSQWEAQSPTEFSRIEQDNWQAPDCTQWTATIETQLAAFDTARVVLTGHSVGCAAIVQWYARYRRTLRGALLVAPSDVDHPAYPPYITGFSPLFLAPLPFPSIVVASSNDHVVALDRARYFAACWGSQFVELPLAGHIEGKSGFGAWPEGLQLVRSLAG